MTDILRLEILLERGGIYLDIDVLSLNPLTEFLDYPCVIGEEQEDGSSLSNAVLLAEPGAEFIDRWYKALPDNWGVNEWAYHAVVLPRLLADRECSALHIEPHTSFIPFTFREPALFELSDDADVDELAGKLRSSYCIHLWQTIWWDSYLKDISPTYLQIADTTFSRLFREYA
jgi:hypothetical protein